VRLKEVWEYRTAYGRETTAIAHWNGSYLLASDCAELIRDGERLNRACGDNEMSDVSVFKGTFLLGNYDGNVYMVNENGEIVKRIHVGLPRSIAVTMLHDGFVGCGEECALYDDLGSEVWNIKVGYVANGPAYWKGYLFIPDHGKKITVMIKDVGVKLFSIPTNAPVYDVAACDDLLALGARGKVALLDISDIDNIKDMWVKTGVEKPWNVAFSPDCEYVAFTDTKREKLRVYSRKGELVAKRGFSSPPWGLAWGEEIVVGLEDGRVYALRLLE